MSAEPPTEEDVLAALLVRWMIVSPDIGVGPKGMPLMAWADIPMVVRMIAGHGSDLEVVERAIADSERRLEVEQAERAVLRAAILRVEAARHERACSERTADSNAALWATTDAIKALRDASAGEESAVDRLLAAVRSATP